MIDWNAWLGWIMCSGLVALLLVLLFVNDWLSWWMNLKEKELEMRAGKKDKEEE